MKVWTINSKKSMVRFFKFHGIIVQVFNSHTRRLRYSIWEEIPERASKEIECEIRFTKKLRTFLLENLSPEILYELTEEEKNKLKL